MTLPWRFIEQSNPPGSIVAQEKSQSAENHNLDYFEALVSFSITKKDVALE
jgi:hypothetical protein